jgi:DNA-binding SARP family transcriptional activator
MKSGVVHSPSVQLRVLGPVQVRSDEGRVLSLRRRQERCLLAILLLESGRTVPAGRLADLLWDDEPPDHARRTLRTYATRIRAVLTQAGAVAHGVTLVSEQGGYVLKAPPDMVDVHQFHNLLDSAWGTSRLTERYRLLSDALALWHGRPLADAASDRLRERLGTDLEELHHRAIEDRFTAGLALGHDRELLPELARTVVEHPTRERLVELHMRALYQQGRTGDAIEAYRTARVRLADLLGLDPGPDLQAIHQLILRGQPLPR